MRTALLFKQADQPEEFEGIHRLNHRTFAVEIPQHDPVIDGRLVDRFHDQNVYLIAKCGDHLAGMVALRFEQPFSVQQKAPDCFAQLPSGFHWCEIRLLAVEPEFRGSALLAGLLRLVITTVTSHGFDAAVISATTRQLKLYKHLGFTAFGHLIGRDGAWYQPMWSTVHRLLLAAPLLHGTPHRTQGRRSGKQPLNLLPGPVPVSAAVISAFHKPAMSHRAVAILGKVADIRNQLKGLTGSAHIALLSGGGTLANDIVAGQLSLTGQAGVVVSGGEFGRRLTLHARGSGLKFSEMHLPGGCSLTIKELNDHLDAHPDAGWVWITHCETSTGVLNPLAQLANACKIRGVKLCADCVSSLGVVPVDLRDVWLASGTSGKGLAAYPGVGLIFSSQAAPIGEGLLPPVIDLARYQSASGLPGTLGSNLIDALWTTLMETNWEQKFEAAVSHGTRLRHCLRKIGLAIECDGFSVSPVILTLNIPPDISSPDLADFLENRGFILAAHSDYLLVRNQMQVCLMGNLTESDTEPLPAVLKHGLDSLVPVAQTPGLKGQL